MRELDRQLTEYYNTEARRGLRSDTYHPDPSNDWQYQFVVLRRD